VGAGLITVELRFRAADATKPPAPRVDDGIIHGIEGLVGDVDSLCGAGNESVRRKSSSWSWVVKDGEDLDAAKRDTVLYGDLSLTSVGGSIGISFCDIIVRKVLSLVYN
jgi:hypothetical protein